MTDDLQRGRDAHSRKLPSRFSASQRRVLSGKTISGSKHNAGEGSRSVPYRLNIIEHCSLPAASCWCITSRAHVHECAYVENYVTSTIDDREKAEKYQPLDKHWPLERLKPRQVITCSLWVSFGTASRNVSDFSIKLSSLSRVGFDRNIFPSGINLACRENVTNEDHSNCRDCYFVARSQSTQSNSVSLKWKVSGACLCRIHPCLFSYRF